MAMEFLDSRALREATAELEGESDRAAAIVGASVVERELTDLLLAGLLEVKEARDLIEVSNAPLATFHAKIRVSYVIGLISAELFGDLERVRKVRNLFAHEHQPLSFDDARVAGHVRSFDCLYALRIQLKRHESEPEAWAIVEAHKWQTLRKHWDIAIGSLVLVIRGVAHYQARPKPRAPEIARVSLGDGEAPPSSPEGAA
jgi:DNA-binding MltR family transcriptional regulator